MSTTPATDLIRQLPELDELYRQVDDLEAERTALLVLIRARRALERRQNHQVQAGQAGQEGDAVG